MSRELLLSLLARGGFLIAQFVAVRLYYSGLGEESYALWATWISVVGVMHCVEIALCSALRNIGADLQKTQGDAQCLKFFSSLFLSCCLVALPLSFFISVLIYLAPAGEISLLYLLLVYLPFLVLTIPQSILKAYSFVVDRGDRTHVQQLVATGTTVTIYFCWHNFSGHYISVFGLVIIYGAATVLSFVPTVISLIRGRNPVFMSKRNAHILIREIATPVIGFLTVQIVFVALFMLDRLYLYLIGDVSGLLAFDLLSRITNLMLVAFSVYNSVYWSKLSRCINSGDILEVKGFLSNVLFYVVLLFIVGLLVGSKVEVILGFWLGIEFEQSIKFLGFILLLVAAIQSYGSGTAVVCNAAGRTGIQWKISLVSVLVKVTSLLVFSLLGVEENDLAIGISSLFAMSVWSFYSPFYLNNRLFRLSSNAKSSQNS